MVGKKDNDPVEHFRRCLSAATRAVSGEKELEAVFAANARGILVRSFICQHRREICQQMKSLWRAEKQMQPR